MLRILSAILAGAIVLYASTALYWMTIGREAVGVLPDELPVTSAIREHVPDPGAYYFPGVPPGEVSDEEQGDFVERHRRGPIGMLIVHQPGGGETMEPMTLVTELAIACLTSVLVTLVVRLAAGSSGFLGRWSVALLMGLAAAVGVNGVQWNTFHFPDRYSGFLAAGTAGSWALAGLAIAAIVPRRRMQVSGGE